MQSAGPHVTIDLVDVLNASLPITDSCWLSIIIDIIIIVLYEKNPENHFVFKCFSARLWDEDGSNLCGDEMGMGTVCGNGEGDVVCARSGGDGDKV